MSKNDERSAMGLCYMQSINKIFIIRKDTCDVIEETVH